MVDIESLEPTLLIENDTQSVHLKCKLWKCHDGVGVTVYDMNRPYETSDGSVLTKKGVELKPWEIGTRNDFYMGKMIFNARTSSQEETIRKMFHFLMETIK